MSSIKNNFDDLLGGIHELERIISEKQSQLVNGLVPMDKLHSNEPGICHEYEVMERILSIIEIASGECFYSFYYSLYIMALFSFLEHVALLVLPFWFALRNTQSYWNDFSKGYNHSRYNDFWDFLKGKTNWMDSFISAACHCNSMTSLESEASTTKEGLYDTCDSDDAAFVKELYTYLRTIYRNPIHHGYASTSVRNGLNRPLRNGLKQPMNQQIGTAKHPAAENS